MEAYLILILTALALYFGCRYWLVGQRKKHRDEVAQLKEQNSALHEREARLREMALKLQQQTERQTEIIAALNVQAAVMQEREERQKEMHVRLHTQIEEFRAEMVKLSQLGTRKSEMIAKLQEEMPQRVQAQFSQWRAAELAAVKETIKQEQQEHARREAAAKLGQWRQEETEKIRREAVEKSLSVTTGKVTEHLIPFLPDFDGYNPKDARFLGSPIDFIVFDGLNDEDGAIREVVFVEVKTGGSTLSRKEKQVMEAIKARRVKWRTMRVTWEKAPTLFGK